MLELIFRGGLEWGYGLILECWEYFSVILMDIMSMDFAYLREHMPDALRRGLPGSAVIHGCEDHADGLRVYSHIVSILRLIEIRWALDGIIARCQKPNKETNSRRHAAACCSVKS
ncbi:hypothetical protein NE670_15555 [Flavonifractor plautii]|uniref:hypothetical protein n=1 Tax=Flavonifractor plautii TaxID=292800 RepID=UPI00210E2A13|nr:hypothetical protein [Flavonifractor plautii]MCQ4786675.1 hypothetical protein [Flavonifractor plautii]